MMSFNAPFIAVKSPSLTDAPGKLKDKELIDYAPRGIPIVDKKGLEKEICERYEVF